MTDPADRPDRFEHRMERTSEVAATAEEVWQAIATADGIASWMVPTKLDPQVGGAVSFDQGDFISTGVVTDYTPSHRFAYEEPWPIAEDAADLPPVMVTWFASLGVPLAEVYADLPSLSPVATEFLVEAASGGSCVIRVVTSAYGTGADWEHEFFAEMVAGWDDLLDHLVTRLGPAGPAAARADRPAITITPIQVADLLAEGERMPVYVHVIDHPDGRVLVDTGLTELHPLVADMDPRLQPLDQQDFDLAGIDIVVNTHLHFDHCGGNHLFAGKPIYVQRRELDDARTQDDYTIREWVDAPGVQYVPVDGELELLPGIRLVPAPGHTAGLQVVVVETAEGPVVVGGDVAVWFGELDDPQSEGQLRVRALEPERVWLTHEHEPWRSARA